MKRRGKIIGTNGIDTIYKYPKKWIKQNLQYYFDTNYPLCKFCGQKIKVVDFTEFFLSHNSRIDEEVIYTKCGCGKGSQCIPFYELGGCYTYTSA